MKNTLLWLTESSIIGQSESNVTIMEMKLSVLFIVMNIVNVAIQTIKSIATIK